MVKKLKGSVSFSLLTAMVMGTFVLPVTSSRQVVAADADNNVIYQNDFESDASAVNIGGNKALEFIAKGDANNGWDSVFQKELDYEYADKISSGTILSFDVLLPKGSTYKGVFKAQAVTKMGKDWAWTQCPDSNIQEISIKNFTDAGNGYIKANVAIPFGSEIEKTQGMKAVVPCLAESNCDYKGKIYLDNVKLSKAAAKVDIIYQNNFTSDTAAVDAGGIKALEFTAKGDANNSWDTVFQKELACEYADKINTGATLSYDLLIPKGSTYKGAFKAQAVAKMGKDWTWTQCPDANIQEIGIKNFTDTGNGYLKASVSVAFGSEIEKVQGLKAVVPCLAASNCDYKGKIYLTNVKLVNGTSQQAASDLPKVDPITFDFSNADSLKAWSDGGNYAYDGGLKIGYDSSVGKGAMKLDLDYSKNASSSWSEAKVACKFEQNKDLQGYNRFSFDFIYDPSKMTAGTFKAKLNAGVIDTNISIGKTEDYGNGLKKATVTMELASAVNKVDNFIIGIVGSNTDYKGSVYIDNVTFSQVAVDDGYVTATKTAAAQAPVEVKSNSIVANGKTQATLSSVKLVDDKATTKTAQTYAYLQAVGNTDSVLYGHQNDVHHKAGNPALSDSDTKDVTGSISGVVGIDGLSLTGNELSTATWDMPQADRVAAVEKVTKEAADQGAIITLSAHMPNFEVIKQRVENNVKGSTDQNKVGILSDGTYNFSGYTPGTLTGNIVQRIMPGQDLNKYYTGYLDMLAAYAKAAEKDNITILFRPFHEGTGSWFWWGKAFCDPAAFKDLYKYTVEYLRDVKGVHNFLYEYGPSSDAESTTDYAERYPGDDYVDIVGFDMYHQNPTVGDNFISQFKTELSIVQDFAAQHNKVFAVTETGVANANNQALLKSGNARKDWYNEILDAVSGTSAAYFMLWADFGTDSGFYQPYVVSKPGEPMRGHELLDNFIDFYNKPNSVFANQVGDISKIAATIKANKDTNGYIETPSSNMRVLDAVKIKASVSNINASSSVKFAVKNKTGSVAKEIPATKDSNGKYVGDLTKEMLTSLGATTGTISLLIDGKTYDTINEKFNMPEPVVDPTVVDNFENYYGEDAVLNTTWGTGKGTGCTITPSLSDTDKSEGDYGLQFKYSLVSGGYIGVTKNMNGADWSSKNALQLWTKPDGKKQKVVVQITSGKNVFEVYLNQYPQYYGSTAPVLITIPFSSFVGRDNKKAVFDPKDIESFGLWCNTIVPEGQDEASYKLDSVIYYDGIKAVTSDVKEVTFEAKGTNTAAVFKDVPADSELNSYLAKAVKMNLVKGDANGNFNPDANITRAELAAIAVRALKLETKDYENLFNDVKADVWYAKDVEAVKRAGIIDGLGDGTFSPNNPITNEEMIKIIAAAYTKLAGTSINISSDDEKLNPLDNSTRAETIRVIMELFEKAGVK